MTAVQATPPRRLVLPPTLWLGAGLIVFCEVMLLAVEMPARNWSVIPLPADQTLPATEGILQAVARRVAWNMTPLCWIGYLLVFDGLLAHLSQRQRAANRAAIPIHSIRDRPNRFVFAWLSSIAVWCFFDWVNFYYVHAWYYHGLPASRAARYVGYFIAFAAISPGMLLAAQWFNQLGLARLKTSPVRIPRAVQVSVLIVGIVFFIYPFVAAAPIGTLMLWVSVMFLLDPINHWLGAPSILGDWRQGRWGRTLSLMVGGALCGLCWEFWNYWAISKWTYDLPFVGRLAAYRYFEMPWIGFLGFLPFAIECWVILNTFFTILERLGLRVAEPLPDTQSIF